MLFVQNSKETYIKPDILYNCREILACLLTNLNTQLEIVNGARTLVYGVIFDSQGNYL